MNRFTVEETNLLSIYAEDSKRALLENINAALPFMDADMRELAVLLPLYALCIAKFYGRGYAGACRAYHAESGRADRNGI